MKMRSVGSKKWWWTTSCVARQRIKAGWCRSWWWCWAHFTCSSEE